MNGKEDWRRKRQNLPPFSFSGTKSKLPSLGFLLSYEPVRGHPAQISLMTAVAFGTVGFSFHLTVYRREYLKNFLSLHHQIEQH